MKLSKIFTSLAMLGLVGLAIADDKPRYDVEVIADDGHSEATYINFNSDDVGFNLHDLQVGENQAIVDEQGRTILVTREADGFTFNVDGKSVSVSMFHGEHDVMTQVQGEDLANIDVEVIHEVVDEDIAHDGPTKIHVVKKVEVIAE